MILSLKTSFSGIKIHLIWSYVTLGWLLMLMKSSISSSDVELLALLPLKSSTSKIWAPRVHPLVTFSRLASYSTIFSWDPLSSRGKSTTKSFNKTGCASSTSTRMPTVSLTIRPSIYWPKCWKKVLQSAFQLRKPWYIHFSMRWIWNSTIRPLLGVLLVKAIS